MPGARTAILWGLAAAAAIAVTGQGCGRGSSGGPVGGVIVFEGLYTSDGVGEMEAVSIVDEAVAKELASFFPSYEACPSSSMAGEWKSGYTVYLGSRDGRAVRIMVSFDGESWSVGDGDFQTKGDFAAFAEELKRRAAR